MGIRESIGFQKYYIRWEQKLFSERAENHIMTGFNSIVEEKKVIDLTCGYGSLMFGHNNPEIIEEALSFFRIENRLCSVFRKSTLKLAETMATICKI